LVNGFIDHLHTPLGITSNTVTTVLNIGGQIPNPWGGGGTDIHGIRRLGRTPSRFGSHGEDPMKTNVATVGLLH
jgi:hypothetical protein